MKLILTAAVDKLGVAGDVVDTVQGHGGIDVERP